jgi:hypothetical protein
MKVFRTVILKHLHVITTCIIALVSVPCYAQQRVVDVGKDDISPLSGLYNVIGGQPISMARYVKVVDGTPFFLNDRWMWGNLVVSGGKKYDSIRLRLDLMANEVHYKDRKGNEMIADNVLRELWLMDSVSKKKYHFVHSSFIGSGTAAAFGWHQLLTEGNAMLFKKIQKEITETQPYGSATTEQRINTSHKYFILWNNNFHPVKSIASVAEILSDKTAELQEYISANRLSKGKTDADYISLLAYYNSLFPKQ